MEDQQYVGLDLHRRQSVLVRKDATGEVLETTQIVNDPLVLAEVIARAGDNPRRGPGGLLRVGAPRGAA